MSLDRFDSACRRARKTKRARVNAIRLWNVADLELRCEIYFHVLAFHFPTLPPA